MGMLRNMLNEYTRRRRRANRAKAQVWTQLSCPFLQPWGGSEFRCVVVVRVLRQETGGMIHEGFTCWRLGFIWSLRREGSERDDLESTTICPSPTAYALRQSWTVILLNSLTSSKIPLRILVSYLLLHVSNIDQSGMKEGSWICRSWLW